jgi:hypothetical protein
LVFTGFSSVPDGREFSTGEGILSMRLSEIFLRRDEEGRGLKRVIAKRASGLFDCGVVAP